MAEYPHPPYSNFPQGGGVQRGGPFGGGSGSAGGYAPGGPLFFVQASTNVGGTLTAAEFLLAAMVLPAGATVFNNALLRFSASMTYKTTGTTPDLTFRIRRNGLAGDILHSWTFTGLDTAGVVTPLAILAEAQTVGPNPAVGNLRSTLGVLLRTAGVAMSATGTPINTIDLTTAQTFDLTGQFNASDANNQVQIFGGSLEVLWPLAAA